MKKFSQTNLRRIEENWERIKAALTTTVRLVSRFGFTAKNLVAPLALLPIALHLLRRDQPSFDTSSQAEDAEAQVAVRRWFTFATLKNAFSASSGRDSTRYDVTSDGTRQTGMAKRRAVLAVVRGLCVKGVTPEEIAAMTSWRGDLFVHADAVLMPGEFIARHRGRVESGGKRRYFCEDGELVYSGGRTYALTSRWGKRAGDATQNLLTRFPHRGVRCDASQASDGS